MKTSWFLTLLALLLPVSASAQAIPIHGAPQGKAVYASASEWPQWGSPQCHWREDGLNGGMTAHAGHLEVTAPIYGELSGPVTMNFRVQYFHVAGTGSIWWSDTIRNVVWDATGTSAPPPLLGDPNGLKVYTGHFTLDVRVPSSGIWNFPPKGWGMTRASLITRFVNGAMVETLWDAPFYSVKDPNAVAVEDQFVPLLLARCNGFPATEGNFQFGTHLSAIDRSFPVFAPMTGPVTLPFSASAYAFGGLTAPGTFSAVLNPDRHNGIEGTLLATGQGMGNAGGSYVLDPSILHDGENRLSLEWSQDSPLKKSTLTSILSVPIVKGDGTAPPPPPPPSPCVLSPLMPTVSVTAPGHVVLWHGTVTAHDERGCTATVTQ